MYKNRRSKEQLEKAIKISGISIRQVTDTTTLPGNPENEVCEQLQLMHTKMMRALGTPNAQILATEQPLYIAAPATTLISAATTPTQQEPFSLITRTVRPGNTRLQEKTDRGTVAQALDHWLADLSISMSQTVLFMLAGVANPDTKSSGWYTTVQMVRFLKMIEQSQQEEKPLTVASTARTTNITQTPSSYELLTQFTRNHLTGTTPASLGVLERNTPTQLFAVHIPQTQLPILHEQLAEKVVSRLNARANNTIL